MPRYKPSSNAQGFLVPICFDHQIQPGSLEYVVDFLVDNKIDLTAFHQEAMNEVGGAPRYNPAMLLKVIFCAYSRGIFSSRRVAELCETNVIFIALSANSHPHFTTIADFVRKMPGKIQAVFTDILLVCEEMGLIGHRTFALDGNKLPSNAAKEWSGTIKDLEKKRTKFKEILGQLMKKHRGQDERDRESPQHNLDRRIKTYRKKILKITRFIENNTDRKSSRKGAIKSNITDNESSKMKTGKGVIQGYNCQALVDDKTQVVIHAQAVGNGQDHENFIGVIEEAKKTVRVFGKGRRYFEKKRVLADTGYHNEEALEYAEKNKIDAYVPDTNYRKRDNRFESAARHRKKKFYNKEDFKYEKEKNRYICPAGKILDRKRQYVRNGSFIGRRYQASRKDCSVCPLRSGCIRLEKTKSRTLFIGEQSLRKGCVQRMITKIDSEVGREMYSRRMGIVEPVFGNISAAKRLYRINYRGKIKANVQWNLFCMVHNICKIARQGLKDIA